MAEEIVYPTVQLQKLAGRFGEIQIFPRERHGLMAMGYALTVAGTNEWAEESFRERVERDHKMDLYIAGPPDWVPGAVYIRNYFGTWYGPLDTPAEDVEGCVAEFIEAMTPEGWSVTDER